MRKIRGCVALLALTASACGLAEDEVVLRPDAAGEVVIDMDEFSFGTDRIEVVAGETVTFVLVNTGDNEHEFMIGRNLVETDLGYPNGFEHDFFETTTPVVDPPSAGMDMGAMDMGDMDMGDMDMSDDDHADDDMGDMDMGDDDMGDMDMPDDDHADDEMSDGDMGDMDMGGEDAHAGFMVQRRPGEVARLTVTIPADVVGEWDVGCFRGRGSHWDAGMRTTLVVLAA